MMAPLICPKFPESAPREKTASAKVRSLGSPMEACVLGLLLALAFACQQMQAAGFLSPKGTLDSVSIPSNYIEGAAGVLTATGSNSNGQLGRAYQTNYKTLVPIPLQTGVRTVLAAEGHSFFIKNDSTLWAMGQNDYGQLGDGTRINRKAPILIASGVRDVAAYENRLLILKEDGSLLGAGVNIDNSGWDATTPSSRGPIPIATDVAAVAAGGSHTLFLKSDKTLWGLGRNLLGELGTAPSEQATPIQIASDVVSFAAERRKSFFVKSDGTLWALGENAADTTAKNSKANSSTPVQIASDVSTVMASTNTFAFIKKDKTLWVNEYARKTYILTYELKQVSSDVQSASRSFAHTLFIKSDGTLWAEGVNINGETGTPGGITGVHFIETRVCQDPPFPETLVCTGVTAVSTSSKHSLFVKKDGTMWGMGDMSLDQLGTDFKYQYNSPVFCAESVTSATPGYGCSLYITSDGTLWGIGGAEKPTLLASGVKAAVADVSCILFIKNDDSLWGWGNIPGDVGKPDRLKPTHFADNVKMVSVGSETLLFVTKDGSLYGMGTNHYGQLSAKVQGIFQNSPLLLDTNVRSAAAGNTHILYVKNDNTLWAMGTNFTGTMGLEMGKKYDQPTQVGTDVSAVDTCSLNSLILKTDGTLWGLGNNNQHQFGENVPVEVQTIPVRIASNVRAMATTANSCFYIKTDDSLWAAGANDYGQLGLDLANTPIVDRFMHVADGVQAVYPGGSHTLILRQPLAVLATAANTPTISAIANQHLLINAPATALAFTVSDPVLSVDNLSLSVSSSNPALIPVTSILLSGTGSNRNILCFPTADQSGTASITLTLSNGLQSRTLNFTVTIHELPSLVNISARAQISTGDKLLVSGFVISGEAGQKKRVLVRAVGARLKDFAVPSEQLLADPTLELFKITKGVAQSIATNDNWGEASNAAEITTTSTAVGAFSLDGRPSGTNDTKASALLLDLEPGTYTAQATGKNGTTGVAILEVYDVSGPANHLINLSNRGIVGLGVQAMVQGFVVSGSKPKTYLIRGVGPTLSQWLNPSTLLADPKLQLDQIVNGVPQRVAYNDNWSSSDNDPTLVATTSAQLGAFSLPEGSTDSALVVTLKPGLYTVTCSGVNDTTGVAIVEVYEVP